jgi:hypothetical protein
MRCSGFFVLAGAILVAAAFALGYGGSSAATLLTPRLADFPERAPPRGTEVDVELVLAVDISYSMDPEELALQRDGYVQALQSPEFLNAVREGVNGRIAVTYVEWAGIVTQHMILPWRMLDGPASASAIAAEIMQAPTRRARRTSISGALRFSTALFDASGYKGIRRVIDVSGDGTNNEGPIVTAARDAALAKGVTINGLPIMLKRPNPVTMDIPDLDVYYEDCVIGGPGAFVIPVRGRDEFAPAIRKKLLLEIAGHPPAARVMPAQARAPRVSCTIGERMWQERWGRDDWR